MTLLAPQAPLASRDPAIRLLNRAIRPAFGPPRSISMIVVIGRGPGGGPGGPVQSGTPVHADPIVTASARATSEVKWHWVSVTAIDVGGQVLESQDLSRHEEVW
ncbi:MAG: hypothetical protein JWM19_2995, partial [Actinomycetia bacterium]|nr:hypothetical protein [Actinomycetes bacterium]